MAEVRNLKEGTLWWVAASGSGQVWATASAPASGLIGYVNSFTFTSARTIQVISERGTPDHHKSVDAQPITLQWELQHGVTANYPPLNTTGAGATVPMIHLEHRASAAEQGADSAIYHQFHGLALSTLTWNEGNPANTQSWQGQALAMNGPTASGYVK